MKASVSELALRFARALDLEDYSVLRALLAPNCQYEAPNGPIEGADAIVDSYRRAGKAARSLFDAIAFESALLATTTQTADICFVDRLTKSGRQHVYRCRQRLHFTPGGLVIYITHEELPAEREGFLEFCAAVGIALSDAGLE